MKPFLILLGLLTAASAAPVHLVDEAPVKISTVAPGVILVDFGRVAFGNLKLMPAAGAEGEVTVHFGEAFAGGRINRKPPGTVRYSVAKASLTGAQSLVVAPAADGRNSKPAAAVRTPAEWGVVLPFRWVEIEGWQGDLAPGTIRRQAAFATAWDDQAAAFHSSDETLNGIWELCRYSIKATTFAGIFVDGDRERLAYEADAYLNQLGYYATSNDSQMVRDTFDRLVAYPTWPTEWASHMIFIAHAEWMHSGDNAWLAAHYEVLKTKLLLQRARADGLLVSTPAQTKHDDIVDWPGGERDGFVFQPVNTVVNAFHLRTLALMAEMATALKKDAEAAEYTALERKTRTAFQAVLFDPVRGIYRDGEGTEHASQHASLFPLAFGLVPEAERARLVEWVGKREMACSVYAAQYLLDGLFANEARTKALALIGAPTNRSWKHMLENGTTITWEAWDQRFKPNQDWNHAWGAAPANLLPRYVLGAQPLAPGWQQALIRPNPGMLESAEGKVPTPRGPILISWKNAGTFSLKANIPKEVKARIELPASENSRGVFIGSKEAQARRVGQRWVLDEALSGEVTLEVR